MKNTAGIFIIYVLLLAALYSNAGITSYYNSCQNLYTEFSLQEGHDLAGDLELKNNNRISPVITYSCKNLYSYLLLHLNTETFNNGLLVKSAKGAFLLKKHLLLIYVYHNFW